MAFACNLCNTSNTNKNVSNSNSMTMPTPASTPSKPSLKDAFPQKVGDFTLDKTYEKSDLKGDDKLLPGAEDVMGAVYKSSANKKEQVMAGSYPSAADAETARAKRVSSSKYLARWTKGSILYVATDATFKDKL
ncbi:MAG TPA: hypothetical protein VGC66_22425 [Pyrinomonadaceae bacterium]|jgi:hypothetical protein